MGIVPEECFPYIGHDAPCTPVCSPLLSVMVDKWGYIGMQGGTPTVDALKRAIATYGPVTTAVSVGNEFFMYKDGVFDYESLADDA